MKCRLKHPPTDFAGTVGNPLPTPAMEHAVPEGGYCSAPRSKKPFRNIMS